MTIECRIFPQVSSETSLPWLVQNKPSALIRREENKVEFLKRQFIGKSSGLSTKRNLIIILNVLFPFLSFIGVFSILKCRTLVLKTTTWWTHARYFVDGWHKSASFPTPYVVDHLTFVGKGGMDDLLWVRIFPQTSGVRNSFPDIIRCRIFFPALYRYVMSDILFQWRMLFLPGIFLQAFSPWNQSADNFFLKSPLTSSKVKLSAAKIHQTFAE